MIIVPTCKLPYELDCALAVRYTNHESMKQTTCAINALDQSFHVFIHLKLDDLQMLEWVEHTLLVITLTE